MTMLNTIGAKKKQHSDLIIVNHKPIDPIIDGSVFSIDLNNNKRLRKRKNNSDNQESTKPSVNSLIIEHGDDDNNITTL